MTTNVGYRPLPIDQHDVVYEYGADSRPQPGVARGSVVELRLDESRIYPGTARRVWIHTAAGHDPSLPSRVTFCNDGWWYLDPDGDVRAGIVLDNLAASGELTQMIGVFVDPGMLDGRDGPVKHRNAEYDAFDARYARFLIDDVLPLVRARLAVSESADDRAVVGGSSGGNAAVTAAWLGHRHIARAIAFNPSFAQMPGGNPYPRMLASEPRRGIRMFLHAAHRDLGWNDADGNWFAESLRTAAAFAENGYDVRLVVGDGGHHPNHGGVLLPDALRWLWRD